MLQEYNHVASAQLPQEYHDAAGAVNSLDNDTLKVSDDTVFDLIKQNNKIKASQIVKFENWINHLRCYTELLVNTTSYCNKNATSRQ